MAITRTITRPIATKGNRDGLLAEPAGLSGGGDADTGSAYKGEVRKINGPPRLARSGRQNHLHGFARLEQLVALEGLVELHAVADDRFGVQLALADQVQHPVPAAGDVGEPPPVQADAPV